MGEFFQIAGLVVLGVLLGWYPSVIALSGYFIKDAAKPKFMCSVRDHYGRYECECYHDADCWSIQPVKLKLSDYEKRAQVKRAMGISVIWPLLAAGGVIGGFGWLLWTSVVSPISKGAKFLGDGMVGATQNISEKAISVAVERADAKQDLTRLALEAKKAKVEEVEEPIVVEDTEPTIHEGQVFSPKEWAAAQQAKWAKTQARVAAKAGRRA